MEPFLVSTGAVALAEIGDKTQLLALVLAARHRRPWPIVAGILVATLANHALAAAAGTWMTSFVEPHVLRWVVGLSFVGMAIWTLVPDGEPGDVEHAKRLGSVFLATLVAFFLVEIGDKTQVATVALAARFDAIVAVVLGTTLGMLITNTPAVLFGDAVVRRAPLAAIRLACALLFLVLGIYALVGL